ncbi:hypothetical protein ACFFX0_28410 [Citricoccus parietis]|uniref:Uncharacterized protein n=1 Tax=Citricoccus parietis TaxID=592307 RepID=A0ABV5G5S5_9MICC
MTVRVGAVAQVAVPRGRCGFSLARRVGSREVVTERGQVLAQRTLRVEPRGAGALDQPEQLGA